MILDFLFFSCDTDAPLHIHKNFLLGFFSQYFLTIFHPANIKLSFTQPFSSFLIQCKLPNVITVNVFIQLMWSIFLRSLKPIWLFHSEPTKEFVLYCRFIWQLCLVNVITRLMFSVYAYPKVITLSSLQCTKTLSCEFDLIVYHFYLLHLVVH
jgi:hypothetical protein